MADTDNGIFRRLIAAIRWESEDSELLTSVSKKVMGSTLAVVLVWHFIATLAWPDLFSPSMYGLTVGMLVISLIAFFLLKKIYLLAQISWFLGLSLLIVIAYDIYQQPEILLIFIFLPIMAEVMMGIKITLIMESMIIFLVIIWKWLPFLPPLPDGYTLTLVLSTLASTALGWGISYNLVASIETASHHYREARDRLNEAREHRAEISVLLKDVNMANYQLDRLNTMLSYARGQADKAREERDRFSLAVSHELRSPLNFIIGFSDLMVNSPETYGDPSNWPPGLYDDITEIYKSSTHLLHLINDILDLGKMDAKQFLVFKEKLDFGLIIDDVQEMVATSVTNKGLEFNIVLEPDLPPVFVDRTRIRQVLLNLVTNSLRFTRKGSITIKAYRQSSELLRVEVIDTGKGISKDDLSKVFNEFRQIGDESMRTNEGSGLGLSIGRRFIKMHSGEMGVESEPGKGSTFHFTVPFHQAIDDVAVITAEESFRVLDGRMDPAIEKTPLILLMAADAFSAQVFAKTIPGYKVTILTDPTQLAAVVKRTFPRAIIIDESLASNPIIRKFELTTPFDLPILTFPLPKSRQNRTSNLPQGVVDYLVKPVPRQLLSQTVSEIDPFPPTILIVDDDPSMGRFVTQALKKPLEERVETEKEYKLLFAYDGQEALRYLQSIPVGVVFLDLDLTDMNGLTLLTQMQNEKNLSQIPVVIISASDPPPSFNLDQRSYFRVEVNRLFESQELTDMVNHTLQHVSPIYQEKNGLENVSAADEGQQLEKIEKI